MTPHWLRRLVCRLLGHKNRWHYRYGQATNPYCLRCKEEWGTDIYP